MKSKKLVITEEEALKLYPNASTEWKEILENNFTKEFLNKKITDIVFNEETLAKYLGLEVQSLFIYSSTTEDKHEKYMNACNILPKIAKVYNEGKILDWSNTNEYKYLAYKNFSRAGSGMVFFSSWCHGLDCPFGFYFKKQELSKTAYDNFKKYYEDFWGVNE